MPERVERWREADVVLGRLLDLPAGERRQALDQEHGDDPELHRLLVDLLAAAEAKASAIDDPTQLLPSGLATGGKLEPLTAGARFGPYRLLQMLGEGGMGRVFLAERADGDFQRRVAIKTLKERFESPPSQWRFDRERQILAELEHPNIARLYDSGTDADGGPFMIMEYVDGEALDRYCDRHRLSIDRRLELFATVCDAVQVAHQNLLVHRDLKPQNILVTAEGAPKLIDFGIAKALQASASAHEATRSGLQPLTLLYASPEQLAGKSLTTASDVWALGVVLYELLCGQPPVQVEGLPWVDVWQRLEAAAEPPPPSRVAASDGDASARGSTPAALAHRLRGDLDWIVLRALAREPTRRYGSAGELAADIQRYRRGFPVSAVPETRRYRLRRWIGRHRLAVAASVASALVIVGFLVALTVSNQRTEQARLRTERVAEVLVDMLRSADPSRSGGNDVSVRQILDQGLRDIERGLKDEPALQADLFVTMVRVYDSLGAFDQAEVLVRRALASRIEMHGERHAKVAEGQHYLGRILRLRGDYEDAESLLAMASSWRRRHLGSDHVATLESQIELAICWRFMARYDDASELLDALLPVAERVYPSRSEGLARVLDEQGMLQLTRGLPRQASQQFTRQLAIYQSLFESPDVHLSHAQSQLALALEQLGDWQRAAELYRGAVATERQLYGAGHPELASSLNNLASVSERLGRYAEAEALYREVLDIDRQTLGTDHPYYAISANNLAILLRKIEGAVAAIPWFRQAVAIERASYGEEHPETASSVANLGQTLVAHGALDEADQLLELALDLQIDQLGADHRLVAGSYAKRAALRDAQGAFDAAIEDYRRALDGLEAAFGGGHVDVAALRLDYADLLRRVGRARAAREQHALAAGVLEQRLPESHPLLAQVALREVALDLDAGDRESCQHRIGQAIELLLAAAPESIVLAEARSLSATCSAAHGRMDEARRAWSMAVEWSRRSQGESAPLTRSIERTIERWSH